jgi:hypothetical protein
MILHDTNGDGKADSSKIFVEDKDLIAPVGIAVIGNKVIVSCSPNLIVYTDETEMINRIKKRYFLQALAVKIMIILTCRLCRPRWQLVF